MIDPDSVAVDDTSCWALRAKFIEELAPYGDAPFFCVGEFSWMFEDETKAIEFWTFCGLHFPYTVNPVGGRCRIQFKPSHAPLMRHELQKQGTPVPDGTSKKRKHRPQQADEPDELLATLCALKNELALMTSERQHFWSLLNDIKAKLGSIESKLALSATTMEAAKRAYTIHPEPELEIFDSTQTVHPEPEIEMVEQAETASNV